MSRRSVIICSIRRIGSAQAKRRFFMAFGFTLEDWTAFAVALKRHAVENEVSRVKETGFGPRYEIDGEIETPSGKRPRVRTVWQLDEGQKAPRLLTAYPLEAIQ